LRKLSFGFEGKEYKFGLTIKEYSSATLYYALLMNQELIGRFSSSYIFCYVENLGLTEVRSVHEFEDRPIIEALEGAINGYIQTRNLHT
jgi:hypothetical protein